VQVLKVLIKMLKYITSGLINPYNTCGIIEKSQWVVGSQNELNLRCLGKIEILKRKVGYAETWKQEARIKRVANE